MGSLAQLFTHFAQEFTTVALPVILGVVKVLKTPKAPVEVLYPCKVKKLWLWIEVWPQRWELDLFILLWRQSHLNRSFSLILYVPFVLPHLFARLIPKRRVTTLTVEVLKFSFGEKATFLLRRNNVLPLVAYFVYGSALSPRELLVALATLVFASVGCFQVAVDCGREGHVDSKGSPSGSSRDGGLRMLWSLLNLFFHVNVCSFC